MNSYYQCQYETLFVVKTYTFGLFENEIRLVSIVTRHNKSDKQTLVYHHDTDFSTVETPEIPKSVAKSAVSFFRRRIKMAPDTKVLPKVPRNED